jgi:hypothetical protein
LIEQNALFNHLVLQAASFNELLLAKNPERGFAFLPITNSH